MRRIGLDPGHGNRNSKTDALDVGALGVVAGKIVRKESEHELLFALRVKDYLLTQPDTEVVMLREVNDDKVLGYRCNLDYRINLANVKLCNCFVSLHENALSADSRGYEVYTQNKPTNGDVALATAIYNSVTASVPSMENNIFAKDSTDKNAAVLVKRGLKKDNFRVCVEPNMPSCLVETLFVDNIADRAFFDKHFDDLALATAKGIMKGIGATWISEVPPVTPPVVVIPTAKDYVVDTATLKSQGYTNIIIKL